MTRSEVRLSEEKTFFEGLKKRWQNNKAVASLVFGIVAALAGVKAFSEIRDFYNSFDRSLEEMQDFNRTVQPIYFVDRYNGLADGQHQYLAEIVEKIVQIQPNVVILHSHTSKVAPGPNFTATRTRGTHLARTILQMANGRYTGEIIVVAYGAAKVADDPEEYQQRVEIEISDNLRPLVGKQVISSAAHNPLAP